MYLLPREVIGSTVIIIYIIIVPHPVSITLSVNFITPLASLIILLSYLSPGS